MKENPQGELGDQKSGRLKNASFYELVCFVEKQAAVFTRRVVARELDQVTAVQKIAQEGLFVARKWRSRGKGVEKFYRSLARDWQLVLLGDVSAEYI
jgi:hypothetical protein